MASVDLGAFIDRYDQAWNDQDVEAIVSMHAPDMVFENHTRGVRVEGPAVRELLESTFAGQPDLRFRGRRRYVGDDFVVSEWTATATDDDGRAIEWDGVDVFPFRDGLIARKDVYSSSHSPRVVSRAAG
jgi:ketosteroid isomerase-like protein